MKKLLRFIPLLFCIIYLIRLFVTTPTIMDGVIFISLIILFGFVEYWNNQSIVKIYNNRIFELNKKIISFNEDNIKRQNDLKHKIDDAMSSFNAFKSLNNSFRK